MADWGSGRAPSGEAAAASATWDAARRARAARWRLAATASEFGRAVAERLRDWARRRHRGRAACCRGCRSPSASASRSISPPTASRAGGRRCAPRGAVLRRRALRARARPVAFPVALACRRRGRGLCRRDAEDRARSRIRCWRGRRATSRSQASSRCARSASAPTASSCACCRSKAAALEQKLERVRVSVKKGTAPPVGASSTFKARLSPPLEPLRPGGYDFARDLYFQRHRRDRLRAGRDQDRRAAGAARRCGCATPRASQGMRDAIDARIRAVAAGRQGRHRVGAASPASATRSRRRSTTRCTSRASRHVLSISGYHMAVVAGVVFFALRALLALIPALAPAPPDQEMGGGRRRWSRRSFYLLLSGAEVATQRSFIMTAVVLIGVMVDRPRADAAHACGRGARRAAARAARRWCIRASRCRSPRRWRWSPATSAACRG